MTLAPVVIRSRSTPFVSLACGVLTVYFVIKAILLSDGPALFSLLLGVVAAAVGLWWLWRSRTRAVVIDSHQFIVTKGATSTTYQRADIAEVNLAGLSGHVMLRDGSGVWLPLEGGELVEAGILLSPPSVIE